LWPVVGGNIHVGAILYDHLDSQMKKIPSTIWPVIAVDRSASRPLHKQIYDVYRTMIVEGNVGPGQKIPSTRALAVELKISRIPVLTAYAQLLAEGYFESRTGAGTFVCDSLPGQFARRDRGQERTNGGKSGSRSISRRASLLPQYQR